MGILNSKEKLFDVVHIAANAKVEANGSVLSIPDSKGKFDLNYDNDALLKPTITKVPPQLLDGFRLQFNNQPRTYYTSNSFDPISPPFEVWIVDSNMPGQGWEAKTMPGGNAAYLANNGSGIRLLEHIVVVPNSVEAPNYVTVIQRIVVKPAGADYYQNGVYVGSVTLNGRGLTERDMVGNTTKTIHSIGTNTNNSDWDFFAQYFKAGTFTPAEAKEIYNSLAAKWHVGSTPNQILLSDINWTNKNGIYTPSAKVIKVPKGVIVAPPSKWDYQWYYVSGQSYLADQTLFSTKMTVKKGDFPINDAKHLGVQIKFRVRPKDIKGNSWRWFSGTYSAY
ncbi:MAG TPA: hypothetical protein VL490_10015 [Mucilaginibacter sp.]|nr:hypothetical protein [Mucilaginibacter sp.]